MATINLRDYYPWYAQDEFLEVTDEVAAEMLADKRYQKTHERTARRNAVHSLDAEDGTETAAAIVHVSNNPEVIFEKMERHCRLCRALNSLPDIQGRRVEAHYILGMSRKEIAAADGVSESSVNESIERGLRAMKKYFGNFEKLPCQTPCFCPDI